MFVQRTLYLPRIMWSNNNAGRARVCVVFGCVRYEDLVPHCLCVESERER